MIESTEKLRKITGLYICKADDVLRINEIENISYLNFNTGKDWEQIKFTECNFSEKPNTTDHGEIYTQKLNVIMAGDDSIIQKTFQDYSTRKPIFKIEYDNEEAKLLGTKTNYCIMNMATSSENFETKLTLEFSREDSKPANWLYL